MSATTPKYTLRTSNSLRSALNKYHDLSRLPYNAPPQKNIWVVDQLQGRTAASDRVCSDMYHQGRVFVSEIENKFIFILLNY